MRRLRWLSALLLLSVAPSGLGPAAVKDSSWRDILVTLGEVDDTHATLWLRAQGAAPLTVQYGPAGDPGARTTTTVRPSPARDFTARVPMAGLRPGTRHEYEVRHDADLVTGSFTTAPARDADAPVRLLWSGDLGGRGYCRDVEDGYRIFRAMTQRRPELFLFVGDTVYADQSCGGDFAATMLGEYHAKQRYNRADAAVQQFFRTTAVFAIWDDHEVRNDFSGPDEPLMPIGRQAFLDYWPIAPPAQEPGRLYRSVRWGRGVEVFILDTRQYRSADAMRDGPRKTMLGEAQREWLLDAVASSDATWKLIVTSVPLGMFTGSDADAWSSANVLGFPRPGVGFVHERDLILRELRQRRVRNVVFVGGEVHHGELVRHEPFPGWPVFEFVAGPLAARPGFPLPLDRSLGSRSLGSLGWTHNFGEIEADGESLRVSIVDASGTTRVAARVAADPAR